MATVTVRYFAAARAAAGGLDQETVEADTPESAFAALVDTHGPELARVVGISSYLLDGVSLSREALGERVVGAVRIDVLPPFAGG